MAELSASITAAAAVIQAEVSIKVAIASARPGGGIHEGVLVGPAIRQ